MLEGRRAFSKDEVKMLMLGRFEPAKIPKINLMNENGFSAMIKNINREKGTYYTPNQFYNIYDLNDIYQAWRAVPLGQDPTLIEQEINVPFDVRAEEIKEMRKKIAANKKHGHNLILSAKLPDTIDTVAAQNTIWKYQSEPSE